MLRFIFILATAVLAAGCITIDGDRIIRSTDGAVNGVINGTVEAAADTTECGIQAKLGAVIMKGVAKNGYLRDYAAAGDYSRCVDQKRRLREDDLRRQQWAFERAQEENRRAMQQAREEARRNAPQCNYREVGGKQTRTCTELSVKELWRNQVPPVYQ